MWWMKKLKNKFPICFNYTCTNYLPFNIVKAMHSISNNLISIEVSDKGAELQSIYHKHYNLEYLWAAKPVWPKKSPVLFPIVGGLKDGKYKYKGHDYKLGRHGFARDMNFELANQSDNSLTFSINSSDRTKELYPFDFLFSVIYTIDDNRLTITYKVENIGKEPMLFSVGAHPAFAVPLVDNTKYEDYYLQFNKAENIGRFPLSAEGLTEMEPYPFLKGENKLQLKKELFYKDAIVFKNLQSDAISIISDKTEHGVRVAFNGFPYMGIWAAKDADFVCIEPWAGIADSVNASGNLEDKEGIQTLTPQAQIIKSFSIEVF